MFPQCIILLLSDSLGRTRANINLLDKFLICVENTLNTDPTYGRWSLLNVGTKNIRSWKVQILKV